MPFPLLAPLAAQAGKILSSELAKIITIAITIISIIGLIIGIYYQGRQNGELKAQVEKNKEDQEIARIVEESNKQELESKIAENNLILSKDDSNLRKSKERYRYQSKAAVLTADEANQELNCLLNNTCESNAKKI